MNQVTASLHFAAELAFAIGMPAATHAGLPADAKTYLTAHCFDCHDEDVQKGGLNLASLAFSPTDADNFQTWKRVFERVRDGEMPPAKKPQPAPAATRTFLKELGGPLVSADRRDIAERGRVRGRRLTRTEYEHTVHDLLGIDIPLRDLLPEDPQTHGFETVADGQQLSHHQLARYLDVADLALDEAFSRALTDERGFERRYSPEQLAKRSRGNYRGPDLRGDESISWPITLQFFGRMPVTTVPRDGWYRITLRDVRSINAGRQGAVWGTLRSGACSSAAPMLFLIGLVEATPEPRDLVFEAWIQKGHMLELKPNDAELRRAPTGAQGGNVSFRGRDLEKQGFAGIAHQGIEMEAIHPFADRAKVRENLFGDWTAARAKADPAAALQSLVGRFAARAFRRPATAEQTAPYLELGRRALAKGDSLTDALLASYRAILCSPRFLSFIESPGSLDDHAIANRLSYALWVSMPDAELLRLADDGGLRKPGAVAAQVERLLADPKAERFVRSFTDQWLKLKEIDFTSPDRRQFRTFDPVLQESMLLETRRYFAELIQADLGVDHFVDADFTFLNGRLARHYQADVRPSPGDGLQRVALNGNRIRGGLVTQGAVLKVTADGTRTSPVVRGVFVNERILGQHVPPPPPGVPAIEPDIRGATSIRDQLDKHRSNAACQSCHLTIDPPGFALENFDPIGGWRKRYGVGGRGVPIDPSGATPDGEAFADLVAWKDIYKQRDEAIAAGFAGQFLTYATGAPPRMSDHPAIAKIVAEARDRGYGVRSLVKAVVASGVFLHK